MNSLNLTENQMYLLGKLGEKIDAFCAFFQDEMDEDERISYGSVNITFPGSVYGGEYRIALTVPTFPAGNLVVTTDNLESGLGRCIDILDRREKGVSIYGV